MSNKPIFTSYDVYGFKRALALWSAKNNFMIAKYEELFNRVNSDEDDLYLQTPSHARDMFLNSLACKRSCYQMILDDLRVPCDSFISELEWQNAGKEL